MKKRRIYAHGVRWDVPEWLVWAIFALVLGAAALRGIQELLIWLGGR